MLLKGSKAIPLPIFSNRSLAGELSDIMASQKYTPSSMQTPPRSLRNPARQIFHVFFLQNAPFSGIAPRLHRSTIRSIR